MISSKRTMDEINDSDQNKKFKTFDELEKAETESNDCLDDEWAPSNEDSNNEMTKSNEDLNNEMTKSNEDLNNGMTKSNEDLNNGMTKSNEDLNNEMTKSNEESVNEMIKSNEESVNEMTKLDERPEIELAKLIEQSNIEMTKLIEESNNEMTKSNEQFNNQMTKLNKTTTELLTNDQYKNTAKSMKDGKFDRKEKLFEDLNLDDNILKGIELLNLEKPSKFQCNLLSLLNNSNPNKDYLINVNLLKNKELSILLYAYQLIDSDIKKPQLLIVVPTFELADQLKDQATKLFKYTDISISSSTIGIGKLYQKIFKEQIIITSLGAAILTILKKDLIDLSKLKLGVFDFMDLLISSDMNRGNLGQLFRKIRTTKLFFTSSISTDRTDDDLKALIPNKFIYHNLINKDFLKNLIHFYAKFQTKPSRESGLIKIIENLKKSSRVIIYLISKMEASYIFKLLKENNFTYSYLINGDKSHDDRLNTIKQFNKIRPNNQTFLIVNYPLILNIANLNNVDVIINYDLPFGARLVNEYFHRISHLDESSNKNPKFTVNFVTTSYISDCNKIKIIERGLGLKFIRLRL